MKKYYQKHRLGTILLIWLAIIMTIALTVSSAAGYILQDHYQKRQAFSMLSDYITHNIMSIDVDGTLNTYFDEWMDDVVDIPGDSKKEEFYDNERLKKISIYNDNYLNEVSIGDRDGIIIYSSNNKLIGINIRENERLSPFACLLEGETSYSDSFKKSPFNDSVKEAYAGRAFRDKSGFMLWGLNEDIFKKYCRREIETATEDSRIGMTGFLINCDLDKNISCVTHTKEDTIKGRFTERSVLPEEEGRIKETISNFYGEDCYVGAIKTADYYVIGAYPLSEADQFKLQNYILFAALFLVVLAVFFVVLFVMLKRLVIKGVERTHTSLNRIIGGDLEEKVDVRGSVEFVELSSGINETVGKLKELIKAEQDRIKNEISAARYIQESAVPGKFPPYPDNGSFGLFASMNTAEEVGGDFYDFFMADQNTLAIVIADVCGRGLPAALYMMRSKALIKSCIERGLPVDEVAKTVNEKLYENTSGDMALSVTALIGFLDLRNGVFSFVNAGHTLPLLVSNEVSFVKQKNNTMLGEFQNALFDRQEIRLKSGDSIFLYTDGITEAKDADGKIYGDDRLLNFISNMTDRIEAGDRNDYCREACEKILSEVKRYGSGTEQADDITMLWVKYTECRDDEAIEAGEVKE